MSTLSARGREIVDPRPLETYISFPARPSMVEIVRAQVMRAMQDQKARDELVDDIDEMDFESDDGPLDGGPYVVPDVIPDKINKNSMMQVEKTAEVPPQEVKESDVK